MVLLNEIINFKIKIIAIDSLLKYLNDMYILILSYITYLIYLKLEDSIILQCDI